MDFAGCKLRHFLKNLSLLGLILQFPLTKLIYLA
jgi:hypothetical protein